VNLHVKNLRRVESVTLQGQTWPYKRRADRITIPPNIARIHMYKIFILFYWHLECKWRDCVHFYLLFGFVLVQFYCQTKLSFFLDYFVINLNLKFNAKNRPIQNKLSFVKSQRNGNDTMVVFTKTMIFSCWHYLLLLKWQFSYGSISIFKKIPMH
jgi:hypothetical protein